jgi:ATP-dependent Clp protease protease subunit
MLLDRIIFLSGEVNTASMDTIVAQLLYLDSIDERDINIYINTGGGDCYSGLELVSVMNFVKSKVSTTVLGLAASMGAVIASSGEKGKRFLLPYSRFMVHQPLSSFGYAKFTDSRIALNEMESVRNDLYEILSKNSGKSTEEIITMCENGDRWMKPKEVIDLGFADTIIEKQNA